MTDIQKRKLANQHLKDGDECQAKGFRTIAAVNYGMAKWYIDSLSKPEDDYE